MMLETPRWYRGLLRAEELVLRATISSRLRARDAQVPLGGPANRVRHPTLGHVAAERLIPGEGVPGGEMEQHVARYAWAFRFCEGKHVVDVGCGGGYGSFLLSWVAREVDAVDRDGRRSRRPRPRTAVRATPSPTERATRFRGPRSRHASRSSSTSTTLRRCADSCSAPLPRSCCRTPIPWRPGRT